MFDYNPTSELKDNRLLSALTDKNPYSHAPHFETVKLQKGQILDDSQNCAYFPVDSIISLVSMMEDERMELAMVGLDGATGVFNLLGFNSLQFKSVVQVAGTAYRIESGVLRERLRRSDANSGVLLQYLHALYAQIAQVAICHRRHRLKQRLQTWMTMMFNRLQTVRLKMKQDEIAETLGYARQSVSAATAVLQEAGIISYSRGYIDLLDRARLENGACECCSVMESHYAQIESASEPDPVSTQPDSVIVLNEQARIYIDRLGQLIGGVREICDRNDSVLRRQQAAINLKDALSIT